MRPTIPLSIAACIVLSGCGGLRRSPAWETVLSARVDTRDTADPSAAYAEHVSGALKSANVTHKVVTYEYRYRTRLREEMTTTRTALLYRDEGTSTRHPWWLVDEYSRDPVWLPGENLEYQLEFYLHKPVTVLTVDGKPASDEAKRQIASPDDESPSLLARLWPVKKTERSRRFAASAKPAPKSNITARHLAMFRARHGSTFDPASVMDRVKMERLTRSARVARL